MVAAGGRNAALTPMPGISMGGPGGTLPGVLPPLLAAKAAVPLAGTSTPTRCAVALPAAAVTGSTGGAVLFEAVTLPAGGTSQAQVAGSGWAAEDASGAPLGAALALPCNQSPELPRWGKS